MMPHVARSARDIERRQMMKARDVVLLRSIQARVMAVIGEAAPECPFFAEQKAPRHDIVIHIQIRPIVISLPAVHPATTLGEELPRGQRESPSTLSEYTV